MAIQVNRLSGPRVGVAGDENTLVVPDLVALHAINEIDHQTESKFVADADGNVARLDFYYQGRIVSESGVGTAQGFSQTVDVWPLLLVVTISVLLYVAQWGRSLTKIHAAEGIPKRVRHSIDMLSEGLLVMDKHSLRVPLEPFVDQQSNQY